MLQSGIPLPSIIEALKALFFPNFLDFFQENLIQRLNFGGIEYFISE